MASEGTRTRMARTELERNEAIVMIEGSLRRERVVSLVRVFTIVMIIVTSSAVEIARGSPFDTWRAVIGGAYLAFAIGVWNGVRAALAARASASVGMLRYSLGVRGRLGRRPLRSTCCACFISCRN